LIFGFAFYTVGIDLGLKDFLVTSTGESVTIPQHYRKSESKLIRLQQKFSKTKSGSKRRHKKAAKLAKHHHKIANQRRDFHHKVAKSLVDKYEVVAHEDLKIKNMSARSKPREGQHNSYLPNGQSAKSGLNKSILDAGWGQFLLILAVKASRAGRLTLAVNPNGTSQVCSSCDAKVTKLLSDRWHSCPHCGCELDRDHNAAINIKKRAVGHPVLNALKSKSPKRSPRHTAVAVGDGSMSRLS
jgi:putative transposase